MLTSALKNGLIIYVFGFAFLLSTAKAAPVQIEISWKYKKFDFQVQLYDVRPDRATFVSETAIVPDLSQAPVTTAITKPISVEPNSSKAFALVVQNSSDTDLYFFAVPHELHPASASAGHFFECLCVGRVYKIPKKSVWYRIVRLNLNSSFQNLKSFKVEHQIVGLSEKEANSNYADRLYKYK